MGGLFCSYGISADKIKTTRKTRGLKGPSRACCQLRLKTLEEFANRIPFSGRR